jgi:hypothetical protein
MESRTAWDAENQRALEEIRCAALAIARKIVAVVPDQPTPHGQYIVAVARKGLFLDLLAGIAPVKARLAALTARIEAGYPEPPASARFVSAPRRLMSMDSMGAAEVLEGMAASVLELAGVLRGMAANPAETVHYS